MRSSTSPPCPPHFFRRFCVLSGSRGLSQSSTPPGFRPGTPGFPKRCKRSVHSAFYNGYTAMTAPGGALATRYGGELVLKVAFALVGVDVDAFATGAERRPCGYIGCQDRMVHMGTVFPSLHSILARVVPSGENAQQPLMTSGMYFEARSLWLRCQRR